jgi:hypothetical protein
MALKLKTTRKLAVPKKTEAPTFGDDDENEDSKAPASGVFATAKAEKKKQDMKANRPWEVNVPVGGSLEVYFLDKGEPFARYEHSIGGGPNKRAEPYPCIKDSPEACPACQKEGKEGSYVLYLTCVVPIEKYENKDGETITRRFSKKLFPIRVKMASKYQRLYEKYGSFRGLVVRLHRDQKMDPRTGSDVEFVRRLSEKEILALASCQGIKGLNKESIDQIKKAKIDQPYDYARIFPPIKAKELAAMLGQRVGSRVGSQEMDDDEDMGASAGDWGVE